MSVIIPVFNGGEKFQMCLQSLKACSPAPDEVIVVADGESDGSWRFARDFGFSVIVLERSTGPANARNQGAQTATGEILFFIDADVTVKPDVISVVRNVFETHPGVSAAIGSYDDAPLETNFLSQFKNLIHHYVHQHSRTQASTFWGACGAILSQVFRAVNGFDARYRNPSIEDIELGCRLVDRGYLIRLEKTLCVKHLKRWQVTSLLRADILYRALPWSELIIRQNRLNNDLNLTLSSRASAVLVFLGMISMVLIPVFGAMAALAFACGVLLMILNRDVYRFFLQKRGRVFTVKAVFWHWLYYLYSGAVFGWVLGREKLRKSLMP
ncbi:MAG: glycosyltransferase family 2 protein [Pseudomonadota bacterium]